MSADDGTAEPSILRIRFPDGDVELRWTTNKLAVGVLVRSRGALWRVSSVDGERVVLEPASSEAQAQHGPVVEPTPLGDDSVFLETIVEA
jgi:hypothetical protein